MLAAILATLLPLAVPLALVIRWVQLGPRPAEPSAPFWRTTA